MRIKTVATLLFVSLFITACTQGQPAPDDNESPFTTDNSISTDQPTDANGEPLTEQQQEQAQERNNERQNETEQLADAIAGFEADGGNVNDNGIIPDCEIGFTGIGTVKGLVDLQMLVPDYLDSIPRDPSTGSDLDSGYAVCIDDEGKYVVTAPGSELNQDISVSK